MIKDLVIIGGGPAGLTAAIYASRQNMDFRLISKDIGGQALLTLQIENYAGYQLIRGDALVERFEKQAINSGADIKEGLEVKKVDKKEKAFRVFTSDGDCCRARSLIVASGARPSKLGVKGEKKFAGRGIAYCAICDAPLFKGKDVAVIGGGNSALYAAAQFIKLKSKVFLVTRNPRMEGEKTLKEKVLASDMVELITSGKVIEVKGKKMLDSIKVRTPGEEKTINVRGVFVETGRIPSSDFIDCVKKNKKSEIKIDKFNRTSKKGIYAAGDVTDIAKKQVAIAAGEGAKASLNAIDYIEGGFK
ncbi:MAG: NAD(P)/FAD-dependent oxidoreductase [Elusimicrobiota bacterium]